MSTVRVLLVDDHPLFREGLASILNAEHDFAVVGEASDGVEALVKARELSPDLIIMDVAMPGCDGLEATRRIKYELPGVSIVMLTIRDEDEKLFEAIRSGAQGYLLKNIHSKEMLELLRSAIQGEAALTPALGGRMLHEFRRMSRRLGTDVADCPTALTGREQEVLVLVAEGKTNMEIAETLHVSIHTVKSHMRKILAKLHQEHREEAALMARRHGLIP